MRCPRTGCERRIDPDIFACGHHWRVLPRSIKDRVQARWEGTIRLSYDKLVEEANEAWDEL